MKRIIGAAMVVGVLTALSVNSEAARQASQPTTTQVQAHKMTFDGRTALWSVAIKPDKTADFERILTRLRDGLTKSENQERRKQAAGWRLVRVDKALPDGNVIYVHLIDPVVPGAD